MENDTKKFTKTQANYIRVSNALALAIGLNEAIFLEKIHYLTSKSRKVKDGHRWVFNSVRAWQEKYFPFWSIDTIKRAIKTLKTNGYLILGEYNKKKYDKTNWYRVDYFKLNEVVPIGAIWHLPLVQNAPMDSSNLHQPIPYNKYNKILEEKTKKTLEESNHEKEDPQAIPPPHGSTLPKEIQSFLVRLNSFLIPTGCAPESTFSREGFDYLSQLDIYEIAKETMSRPSRVRRAYFEFWACLQTGKTYGVKSTRQGVIKFTNASKERELKLPLDLRDMDCTDHPDHQLCLKAEIEDAHPLRVAKIQLNQEYMHANDEKNEERLQDVFKRMRYLDKCSLETYNDFLVPF